MRSGPRPPCSSSSTSTSRSTERCRMCPALLLLLAQAVPRAEPVDWPTLTQKPYARLDVGNPGLKPLLVAADGSKITTREGWEKVRAKLHDAWMGHLGKPPEKPAELDVRV